MKKGIKVLIGIILLVILLVVIYFLKYIKNNDQAIDYSDLVCESGRMEPNAYIRKDVVRIEFDKTSKVKKMSKEEQYEFLDQDFGKTFVDNIKSYYEDNWEKYIKFENDVLIVYKDDIETLDTEKMNKEEVKVKYEELGYECK